MTGSVTPAGPPPRRNVIGRRIWIVTFTDLASLMTAFFIMIFAMSSVEETRWQAAVDSLNRSLHPVRESERVPTAAESVDRSAARPATALDYLAGVLARTLPEEPSLTRVTLERRKDALVVMLPADDLLAASPTDDLLAASPADDGAAPALAAIGGVLRNIENPVVVTAHVAAPADSLDDWARAVSLADRVARGLVRSGYERPVTVHGRIDPVLMGPTRPGIDIALQASERLP